MLLSVIILTYNEENYIADAIQSVSFADEVIVVDSYSTDKTVAIAESMNCVVVQNPFKNFSSQRNFGLPYAHGKWVLFLDADERISDELRKEIQRVISQESNFTGYKLRFPHYFFNRFLFQKADKVLRLVYNKDVYYIGEVHEKLQINEGEVGVLKPHVIHLTYKGIFHYLGKKDSYAWFQAKELAKRKKKVTYFYLVFKPFYRFLHIYFIKKGFLDGVPGLVGASYDAYGVFSRYVKLMLIERNLK